MGYTGRLIETDENYNIIGQWPSVLDLGGTVNVVEDQFSPHGLSIDFERGIILTVSITSATTTLASMQLADMCVV